MGVVKLYKCLDFNGGLMMLHYSNLQFTNATQLNDPFDYIMANPPFNLKKYAEYGDFETAPRWKGYGVPPTSNANYAWILHILNKLNLSHGIAGFLLANGALDDSDTLDIRKQLIESDKVEAIIVLPRNMFYSTDISVTQSALSEMSHKFDVLKKRWDENEAELVNAFKVLGYGKE